MLSFPLGERKLGAAAIGRSQGPAPELAVSASVELPGAARGVAASKRLEAARARIGLDHADWSARACRSILPLLVRGS